MKIAEEARIAEQEADNGETLFMAHGFTAARIYKLPEALKITWERHLTKPTAVSALLVDDDYFKGDFDTGDPAQVVAPAAVATRAATAICA